MRDIGEWLQSIGLDEYARTFSENAIDLAVLRDITEQDLKDLGVLLGHRRKMLRSVAELNPTAGKTLDRLDDSPARSEAERRQLTVMFCDLVGSTALSAQLDPEDMRQVIATYNTRMTEVISRCNGVVAGYLGDGVLAYFGYPSAHEDDAEQAAHAGLAIIEAITNLKTHVKAALQVRVGIATGTVVVGDLLIGEGGVGEQGIVGDTPNLAARLQSAADPGSVLICANTRSLTGGHFEYRELGALALKGWAEPVPAWQVVKPSGLAGRFEAQHTKRLMPLLGREEEIDLLLRRWRNAMEGEGRVVLLTGEPGIGKSHIALMLEERLKSEPHIRLRYYCSAHHTNSMLFPFIAQLERAARFNRGDSVSVKVEKLKILLEQGPAANQHDLALLANLLSLPADEH